MLKTLLLAGCSAATLTNALSDGYLTQTCEVYAGKNCYGNDMSHQPVSDQGECCDLCATTPGCSGFTLDQGVCYMKSRCDNPIDDPNTVCGIVTGPPAPPTPLPPLPPSNTFAPAATCASDIMEVYPTLNKDWIYKNGTFGGRNSPFFVGWVDSSSTAMPSIHMMDGPQGVRDILNGGKLPDRHSWPGAATYGQAWSPEIAYYGGKFGAMDFRAAGANTALSPGVNVHRLPTNGRNWEYVSGEDAHLGTLAAHLVKGLQSDGMMGSLKHFALNNQELNREGVISLVDEATLMETYLRAFQPTIDAGVGSVMCSYNQIQFTEDPSSHSYTCGSKVLVHDLLRQSMGFGGALMTDWNAKVANSSAIPQDQRQYVEWEMVWGSDIHLPVPVEAEPEIVRNSIVSLLVSGVMTYETVPSCQKPGVKAPTPPPPLDTLPTDYQRIMMGLEDTAGMAAMLIQEAMVLLKNANNTLPLHSGSTVLLMGSALLNGGGSGDSAAFGYEAPYHMGEGLHDGGRMAQDKMVEHLEAALHATVVWDYYASSTDPQDYDVVLAFGAQFRSEAYLVNNSDGNYNIDQCNSGKNYSLYGDCDYPAFLQALQQARETGTKVISITTVGGAHTAFDYLSLCDAALTLFYPGQHFAKALSAVLSGVVSPGGRLSYTIPDLEEDQKHIQSPVGRFSSGLEYTGSTTNTIKSPAYLWDAELGQASATVQYDSSTSVYAEKNLVGYKYYEKYGMTPLFPFGFGLSYSAYESMPSFSRCTNTLRCIVDIKVTKDTSLFDGIASEVLQVYVGFSTGDAKADAMTVIKELRGFQKVWSAGSYSITLDANAFHSMWKVDSRQWVLPCASGNGEFTVSMGTSSADILGSTIIACSYTSTE